MPGRTRGANRIGPATATTIRPRAASPATARPWVAECALREVREEVGIGELAITAEAGTTLHGYPEGKHYRVKTTHWYFMETPERDFTPEEREGIEEVAWVPWAEAQQRLDYRTLRDLLGSLTPPSE